MLHGDLFGSGGGAIGRATPHARLLVAALLVAACVAVPAGLRITLPFTAIVAAATVLSCAAPARVVVRALAFGALLYVPLALLLFVPAFFGGPMDVAGAGAHAFGIAIRGTAVLLVTLSVLSTTRLTEVHAAIGGLPLPRTARLLLIQIVHQTGVLFDETRRVTQAIALRRGQRSGLRLVARVPQVWLERVASRADRTAAAMDVRGYPDWNPPRRALTPADRGPVVIAGAAFVLALLLHVLS